LRDLALLAAIAAPWGCSWPPPDLPDLNPRGDLCEDACAASGRSGCPSGDGSPGVDGLPGTADDVGCVEACHDQLASEPTLRHLLACVRDAVDCAAEERCAEMVP